MKKQIVTAAAFAACLALWAAVWQQKQPVGETPTPPHKNRSLPRHPTAHRTTWSMCRALDG